MISLPQSGHNAMDKSGRVRLTDLRRAYRLIHDCRDAGDDPVLWPAVMAEGLSRLFDARLVLVGEIGTDPQAPAILLADRGWQSPKDRDEWIQRDVITQNFRTQTTFSRFMEVRGKLVTRVREQLVTDDEWYSSDEFNERNRAYGADDMLASHARVDHPRSLFGFNLNRELGHPRFGARERRLARMFHLELVGFFGTVLVRNSALPTARLPPRLQQTLQCLLDGDSEKQVAFRLGLSRHTIHDYVTELYRRLHVRSRAELLSLCLKHPLPRRDN